MNNLEANFRTAPKPGGPLLPMEEVGVYLAGGAGLLVLLAVVSVIYLRRLNRDDTAPGQREG